MPKRSRLSLKWILTYASAQILESGSAASTVTNHAATRGSAWNAFVASVPACASTVGTNTTIACLRNATLDAATLTAATTTAVSAADEAYPYVPTLDGELYPTLPSKLLMSCIGEEGLTIF